MERRRLECQLEDLDASEPSAYNMYYNLHIVKSGTLLHQKSQDLTDLNSLEQN